MKSTILALLVLLLSAFIISSNASSPEEVVDTSGKTLRDNENYYIVPAVPFTICGFVSCFNSTGGITLDTMTQSSSCPLDVVIMKASQGLPLNFSPINPKKGSVIHVSTNLNIRFINNVDNDENRCPQYSRVWKLENFDDDSNEGQIFVTTGGVLGHPGPKTILSWFKIEEYDGAYKLVYCPNVCQSCKHYLCKDIGMFVDKNKRMRLALSDVPFKIKFQKA